MATYALNAVTAPDAYSQAATIEGVPVRVIALDVLNQAIYWQLKIPSSPRSTGGNWDGTENYMPPGSRLIFDRCVGIRFRAAVLASKIPAGSNQAVATVRVTSV